jgi:hypothetical protein
VIPLPAAKKLAAGDVVRRAGGRLGARAGAVEAGPEIDGTGEADVGAGTGALKFGKIGRAEEP